MKAKRGQGMKLHLEWGDPELRALLDSVVSRLPKGTLPIRSLHKVRMKKRAKIKGIVGLTTDSLGAIPGSKSRGRIRVAQTITFYSDLLTKLSRPSAMAVMAHELAHAWLNENVGPEQSRRREREADKLARKWGFGREMGALNSEAETLNN
ncbi:MAG: M48 family metalloprotease [Thaumarchaeota archaeon]|nr:M48 family metalloprotease [Nitrososphaerota archaeon]